MKSGLSEVIDAPRRSRRGRRRRRSRRERRDRAHGSDGLGMRPPAGHEVVGPVGAVRQAGVRQRVQEGGRQGHGRERAERPAEAALAGRAVHLGRGAKVGIITSLDTRHVDRDPEEVHGRRWQDDRLRPPDRRRHRLRLRRRSTATGRASLQARGVLAGMKAKGTYGPNGVVAQLWGGPTDANAFWFKSGNDDDPEPALQDEEASRRAPRSSCPSGTRPERADDLRADARQDEQQHRGRRRRRTTTSPAPWSPR